MWSFDLLAAILLTRFSVSQHIRPADVQVSLVSFSDVFIRTIAGDSKQARSDTLNFFQQICALMVRKYLTIE